MYKYQCKHCKANLDPGEKCDCIHKIRERINEDFGMSRKPLQDESNEAETLRNSVRLQALFREAEKILTG